MIQNSPLQQPQQISIPQNFQFTNRTSHNKYLNCPACHKLMLKAIRLHKCGHTFCHNCVINDKNIKKCLICLQKIQTKQQDILATRLVGQLEVRCMNNGCPWKGTFQNYKSMHASGCKLKNGGIDKWMKDIQSMIENKDVVNSTLSEDQDRILKIDKAVSQLHANNKQNKQNIQQKCGNNEPELQKELKMYSEYNNGDEQ